MDETLLCSNRGSKTVPKMEPGIIVDCLPLEIP